MTYIYDILLNWNNANALYEFYEWEQQDNMEHIKKIPIFKVDSKTMDDFLKKEIKIELEFLNKIKNTTELYKNKRILFASLFTDGFQVLAMLFNEKGTALFKSHLLLDEEEDILSISKRIKPININYQSGKNYTKDPFSTRKDELIKAFLKREIHSCYTMKKQEKLNYIYIEYFGQKKEETKEEMYENLLKSLNQIDEKHLQLYNLLKLSYTKMK